MNLALDCLKWLVCHKNTKKPNHIYLIYMYKKDLALNNLQWLICYKTKPNQTKSINKYTPVIVFKQNFFFQSQRYQDNIKTDIVRNY